MYTTLYAQPDPTPWIVADADAATILRDTGKQDQTVVVPVVAPVQGRLILSRNAAAALAVVAMPTGGDWMPSYIHLPEAHLYLPSVAGATKKNHGYAIAAGVDLESLEGDLVAAIHHRNRFQVRIGGVGGSGTLVINGATVPFAVIVPAQT